jgi:hypothetical protein
MKKTDVLTITVILAVVFSGWVQAAATAACTDSDGGKVYETKGVTNGANGKKTDTCKSPRLLKEYYCENDLAKEEVKVCDGGCVHAACKGGLASDEGKATTQTTIATSETSATIEQITTTTTLQSQQIATASPALVLDSAKCVESDGRKDIYVKGALKAVGGIDTVDKCVNGKKLREWYCSKEIASSVVVICKKGCIDGACAADGTVPIKTTTTTTIPATNTEKTRDAADANLIERPVTTKGTVIPASTASPGTGCSETDEGKDYTKKGTTVGTNGRLVDSCASPATLKEYYCEGGLAKKELYRCEKGCADGRCR